MLPEEKVRLLSLVDVLEPLSEEEIAGLIQRIPSTPLEEGQVFYTPEDRSEALFLLKNGRVLTNANLARALA